MPTGEGAIFFVNQMHDLPGGTSPVSPMHVIELLMRPIVAEKIQCISTAAPTTRSWLPTGTGLAQHFGPVQVASASEDEAIKVLRGIKGTYEQFHSVTYTDDALMYAVYYASRCI